MKKIAKESKRWIILIKSESMQQLRNLSAPVQSLNKLFQRLSILHIADSSFMLILSYVQKRLRMSVIIISFSFSKWIHFTFLLHRSNVCTYYCMFCFPFFSFYSTVIFLSAIWHAFIYRATLARTRIKNFGAYVDEI